MGPFFSFVVMPCCMGWDPPGTSLAGLVTMQRRELVGSSQLVGKEVLAEDIQRTSGSLGEWGSSPFWGHSLIWLSLLTLRSLHTTREFHQTLILGQGLPTTKKINLLNQSYLNLWLHSVFCRWSNHYQEIWERRKWCFTTLLSWLQISTCRRCV